MNSGVGADADFDWLFSDAGDAADRLMYGGGWLEICVRAAQDPTSLTAPGSDHDVQLPSSDTAPGRALYLLRLRGTRYFHAAAALWHSARAESALALSEGRGVVGHAALAAWHFRVSQNPSHDASSDEPDLTSIGDNISEDEYRAAHPELPWAQVADMRRRCRTAQVPPSVSTHVFFRDEHGSGTLTLSFDRVPDPDETALPDVEPMLFADIANSLDDAVRGAYDWIRAQEYFPRGTGVRWRLTGAGDRRLEVYPEAEVGAAAAVALVRLLRTRRGDGLLARLGLGTGDADDRVLIYGRVNAQGVLEPLGEPSVEAARHLVSRSRKAVLHPADAKSARAQLKPSTGRRALREADTVRKAVRRSRRVPRRAVAVAAALILGATATLVAVGRAVERRTEASTIASMASTLGNQAQANAAIDPALALSQALAAYALAPQSPTTNDALVAAGDGDVLITRIMTSAPSGTDQLALNHDGTYLAAVGSNGRMAVWNASGSSPLVIPRALSGVAALAFAPTGSSLAVATDHGVYLWNPQRSQVAPLQLTAAAAGAIAFSPSASKPELAVASRGEVSIVPPSPASSSPLTEVTAVGDVTALVFNDDGTTLAIGTAQKTTAMWAWQDRKATAPQIAVLGGSVQAITYAVGCTCFAVSAGSQIHLVSPTTAKDIASPITVPLDSKGVYSAAAEAFFVAADNAVAAYEGSDPRLIADKSGKIPAADYAYGHGSNIADTFALSANGRFLATPTGSGSIVLSHLGITAGRYAWYGDIQHVFPVPGGKGLLYVTGSAYGPAHAVIFDLKTLTGESDTSVGQTIENQAADFSGRLHLLAVATRDGKVSLYPVNNAVIGGPTKLTGPTKQPAVSVAFDDDGSGSLLAGWSRTIADYAFTPGSDTPRQVYQFALPAPTLLFALSMSSNGNTLFAATNQGLFALAKHGGKFSWGARTQLAAGSFTGVIARPDGSAVGSGINGGVAVFSPIDLGQAWSEQPLLESGAALQNVAAYGPDIVISGLEGVLVFDGTTGVQLTNARLPGMIVTGSSYTGGILRLYGDTPGASIAFPIGIQALVTHACQTLGSGAPPNVAAVWPGAPASVRALTLCP